jgi:hypothetical protein
MIQKCRPWLVHAATNVAAVAENSVCKSRPHVESTNLCHCLGHRFLQRSQSGWSANTGVLQTSDEPPEWQG